ncbi:hypothetical protein BASA81_007542 [Batrachochytrium salamandrivorans]|nr:hypothetical protein BASA81_007542 [Batrachochytrium salamandrivorans]
MSDKPAISASDLTTSHLKKAAQNASGGVDPTAKKQYSAIFTECGGNYDTIAEKLGVTWYERAIKPKTADDFAMSFLQGRLTKD